MSFLSKGILILPSKTCPFWNVIIKKNANYNLVQMMIISDEYSIAKEEIFWSLNNFSKQLSRVVYYFFVYMKWGEFSFTNEANIFSQHEEFQRNIFYFFICYEKNSTFKILQNRSPWDSNFELSWLWRKNPPL